MGGMYLKPLDDLMERLDLPYVRYMDDWVILAKTRWALRRVVQQVNTILDNLKLEKHPDKTFIGRIDRGFDFLGYRFVAEGLRLAVQTKQRFVERATRLYEQGAAASRIGEYVRHWLTWVRSGCLEHVWDELLVVVMRSSDVLLLICGGLGRSPGFGGTLGSVRGSRCVMSLDGPAKPLGLCTRRFDGASSPPSPVHRPVRRFPIPFTILSHRTTLYRSDCGPYTAGSQRPSGCAWL